MGLTRPRFEQINSIITTISDPITVLNQGSSLANIDVGFIFNRNGGISSNVAVFWDESANTFVTSFTTDSGSNNANITITEYANLRVGYLTGTLSTANQPAITTVGNLTSLSLSGNVNTTGYYFGNGSQLTGIITSVTKIISGTSNVSVFDSSNITVSVGGTANTVIFSSATPATSSTTGAVRIAGGLGATGNIIAGDNVTASYFVGSGTALTGINSFGNIFISGQSPVLADNTSDTLTLVAGAGISILTDAANDSVTFTTVSTLGAFAADGDFGLVTDPVSVSEDQGDLASTNSTTYDLGSLVEAEGLVYPDQLVLPSYSDSTLPSATVPAQLVYNTTANGLAFSDGINWSNIGASYSNVQVTTYLPTHSGTVGASLINTSGNISSGGTILDSKGDVRAAPQNSQGGAYTLVVGDAGKHISITTGGVTVNASIFSAGDMITIFNNSGSSQNITQGTSVTLRLAGTATTGTRALAQYGVATLLCVTGGATPTFACSGAGLT
jgi:hypothetical protein